jgi:hypothetical protein
MHDNKCVLCNLNGKFIDLSRYRELSSQTLPPALGHDNVFLNPVLAHVDVFKV